MSRIPIALIPFLFLTIAYVALGDDHGAARLAEIAVHPEVRREIRLTPSQGQVLEQVVDRIKQGEEPRPELRAEVTKPLEPEQLKRLEQIFVQVYDARALGDAGIVKLLDLNEVQRRRLDESIKAIGDEERKMADVMKRVRFPTAEARHRFVEKYEQAANARLLGILNKDQKDRLEKMKGKAFSAVSQLRSHTSSTPRLLP